MADLIRGLKAGADAIAEVPGKTLKGVEMIGQGIDNVFGAPGRIATGFNPAIPSGFSQQVGQATGQTTGSPLAGGIAGFAAGLAEPLPVGEAAKGVKIADELTTKLLERLGGRTVVSKQFIEDLAKGADIKGPEKAVITKVLADTPADRNVDVPTFTDKVKTELLPLTHSNTKPVSGVSGNMLGKDGEPALTVRKQYQDVALPAGERGDVANYYENIYSSPIANKAGSEHFRDYGRTENTPQNYFAHTRVEDLEPGYTPEQTALREKNMQPGGVSDAESAAFYKSREGMKGDTRRIIEIQSDLFQKGNLERETPDAALGTERSILKNAESRIADIQNHGRNVPEGFDGDINIRNDELKSQLATQQQRVKEAEQNIADITAKTPARNAELAQLAGYKNTWWQRIIRDETKQAAQDGKSIIQIPTGRTALKVEGLGGEAAPVWEFDTAESGAVTAADLRNGMTVFDKRTEEPWVVTNVLGDGKFQAVPKTVIENGDLSFGEEFSGPDEAMEALQSELRGSKNGIEGTSFSGTDIDHSQESFDLADNNGDMDKENPIYKYYQDDIGKYVKNRYGATEITDPQGVTWWQYTVPKEAGSAPVEAFGVGALPFATIPGAMKTANSTPATLPSNDKKK